MTEFMEINGKLVPEHDHHMHKIEYPVYVLAETTGTNWRGKEKKIRKEIRTIKMVHKCLECDERTEKLIVPFGWRVLSTEKTHFGWVGKDGLTI